MRQRLRLHHRLLLSGPRVTTRCCEWRVARVACAIGLAGCSSATPAQQSEPDVLATSASTTSSAEAPASSPATTPAAAAAQLSPTEAWQWLRAKLPEETAKLRPDESRANIDKLLAWAPGEVSTVVFDRACRPLTLTRNETTLDGDVNETTTIEGNTKTVHRDGIAFGFDITVVCGSDTIYERNAGGAWVESGGSATGCAHSLGHNLSDVRDGEVWYSAEQVTLTVACSSRHEREQLCTDGSTRTCAACTAASVDIKRQRGLGQTSRHGTIGVREGKAAAVDCSTPCPVDELSPMIAAANAALADKAFEQLGYEQHPTLFRDRAACTAYRRKHVIAKDQVDVW